MDDGTDDRTDDGDNDGRLDGRLDGSIEGIDDGSALSFKVSEEEVSAPASDGLADEVIDGPILQLRRSDGAELGRTACDATSNNRQ